MALHVLSQGQQTFKIWAACGLILSEKAVAFILCFSYNEMEEQFCPLIRPDRSVNADRNVSHGNIQGRSKKQGHVS